MRRFFDFGPRFRSLTPIKTALGLTLKFTQLENVLKPAQPAKMVYSFVNPRLAIDQERKESAARWQARP